MEKMKAVVFVSGMFALMFLISLMPSTMASSNSLSASSQPNFQFPPMQIASEALGPSTTVSESYNWAGYAVSGVGIISSAQGSWIQAAATCNQTATGTQMTAFWVGIDGFATSTVEQTGTLAECLKGSSTPQYFAWYEFYPAQAIRIIKDFKVSPGDVFVAKVIAKSSTSFTLILNDTTTGQSYLKKNPSGFTGDRASAECITEEPLGPKGFFLLANYSSQPWGTDYTNLGGCTANGKAFGSFHSDAFQIIAVNENTFAVMDQPSKLSSDGTSFIMTWESAGP